MPEGQIADEIKRLMKRMAKVNVTSRTYVVDNLPGEYRLTKTIISEKGYLVEIFNSAAYELVPYILVDSIQVAMPNVLLYHLMLDIWFVGTVGTSGKLPPSAVNEITAGYVDIMRHVKANMFDIAKPLFMGVYKDDFLAKKILSLSNKYRPYPPAQYFKSNGKYREI